MIINANQTNAQRFISAYNTIDQTIRSVYNYKRNMTFSDMIRRTVPLNSVVRKYEDKLIDYARLRNSIIHNSNDEFIIAEPHDDVVRLMEKIASMISQPPRVIDSVARKNILTITADVTIKSVIALMASSGFKSLPVYEDGKILGIASPNRVVDWLGQQIEKENLEKLLDNPISETLRECDADVRFCIVSEDISVQEAIDKFFSNRMLASIIITKNGSKYDKISGIITVADIMDLNKIIEDYD